ncbi:hypothetical protein [Lacticaseibacillus saniviri]|uniref:Uncharacterized protein n=2 Tax=Lacticaseibacillus saniviri TaxID=931533 RepID=A0A0R2MWA8_9LACO|nr:hypothetical protein [Lacticaseibacillus saniviri]KRO16528.1 hypothetical protein IV56_GL001118 [Lacticaseibacillus saniviri JCM 17471 = DSM 24301]
MHTFLGFTIGEWGGIIAIGTAIVGAIYRVAVKPLSDKLADLSGAINNLSISSNQTHLELDHRLDKHDIKIERHDAEIQFLYDKNNLKRREEHHEE